MPKDLGTPRRVPFDPRYAQRSIFHALVDARSEYGGERAVLVDGDDRGFTYDEIIRASFALGSALKKGTERGACVGVMLPTGAAAALTFFALCAMGRVPAMLNFTVGLQGVKKAIVTAGIKRLVTARRLIEIANLSEVISGLRETGTEIVYLEDVRKNITLADKLAAVSGSLAPKILSARANPDQPAVILFTSGTEGEPKGVALSHRNVLSNIAQVRAHIDIYSGEIVFNPLPIFHCFGLTVGTILPLMAGVKVVTHPTPLQPKEIVRRIRKHHATMLLSTDTFINQYARAGEPTDLTSLRLAVCGAEKLRDDTRAFFANKFGITLLEGYGVTEASPVIAANQVEDNRPGTVGQLMTRLEAKLVPVAGVSEGGELMVRGPNIMLGYIKSDSPGTIVPPVGGWHSTGDIVSLDHEGIVRIRGRCKRFARIGGEAVSLAAVEHIANQVWPDHHHAAISVPDEHKGEQVVLMSDLKGADRLDLVKWAHDHDVSPLTVPRRVVFTEKIPCLATGKIDYLAIQKLAENEVGSNA